MEVEARVEVEVTVRSGSVVSGKRRVTVSRTVTVQVSTPKAEYDAVYGQVYLFI